MKKAVLLQIILLIGVVLLGFFLKINPISGPRILHKLIGFIAGFVGIFTAFTAYKEKYPKIILGLSILAVLLTLSAGVGGSLLYRISNYNLAYFLMVISGFLALITAIILGVKVRKA